MSREESMSLHPSVKGRDDVEEPTDETLEPEWVLNATNRCDEGNCGAQAYVRTRLCTGELDWCHHHFEEKALLLSSQSFQVIDEREKLHAPRKVEEHA